MDRFWAKVDKSGECWVWTGARNSSGYGQIRIDGKTVYAHRVSFELVGGEIPDGMQVDHLCGTRTCVRPEHLRVCTQQENIFAAHSSAAPKVNAAKTHCPRGHEYTPENTYKNAGRRFCNECRRDRIRASR